MKTTVHTSAVPLFLITVVLLVLMITGLALLPACEDEEPEPPDAGGDCGCEE